MIEPMLCRRADSPPMGQDWIHEFKLDGERLLAEVTQDGVRLWNRRGRERSDVFPEIAEALADQPGALRLDGEIVAVNEQGLPDFGRLAQRAHLADPFAIQHRRGTIPLTYYVFDLLGVGEHDITGVWLEERKRLLDRCLRVNDTIRIMPYVRGCGDELLAKAADLGIEGIVSKKAKSRYYPGKRSPNWLKVKFEETIDLTVVGWTEGEGNRAGTVGALLLGASKGGGEIEYVGKVGSGLGFQQLADLKSRLTPLSASGPTVLCDLTEPVHWVRPELTVEVKYQERTPAGALRFPVFVRLREDK